MKAIKTTYVSATSNKPSRIRASAEGVPSKFYSTHQLIGITQTDRADKWHGLAAELFRDENKWTYHNGNPDNGVQHLASGQLDADTHVHCFIERDRSEQGFLKGKDLVVAQARTFVAESYPTQPAKANGDKACSGYHFALLRTALELLDGKFDEEANHKQALIACYGEHGQG